MAEGCGIDGEILASNLLASGTPHRNTECLTLESHSCVRRRATVANV